eukprot:8715472-Pyramimonas_sp.AAC.1
MRTAAGHGKRSHHPRLGSTPLSQSWSSGGGSGLVSPSRGCRSERGAGGQARAARAACLCSVVACPPQDRLSALSTRGLAHERYLHLPRSRLPHEASRSSWLPKGMPHPRHEAGREVCRRLRAHRPALLLSPPRLAPAPLRLHVALQQLL